MLRHIMAVTLPYYRQVSFIWHGGEPLSIGLDFYKNAVEIQKEYQKQYHVLIKNSIQSNFTLLTQEMIDFFKENDFSLSTSYDGTNNEITRGRSIQIMKGIKKCVDSGIRCGLIMVASKLNIDTFIESYHFFKEHNLNFKINPYFGDDKNLALDYNVFAEKMCELFNYWALDTDTNIQISSFNIVMDYILLHKKSVCSFTSCLGKWAAIDYNGTIRPCNRYFPDEYSYGNVSDYSSFEEAFQSEGFRKLLVKAISRREKCKSCEIFDFCSGGCNNTAMTENGGIENNNGNYCKYLLKLYKYIESFLNENADNSKLNRFIRKKIEMAKSL